MAAISSNADGKWIADAATTWVGGVAPTEGDTVTILNTHDIEIDGNITVGADSATAAIQVNSGGSLFVPSTVAGNYTLTLKGDLKTDATGGTISFGTAANPIPNTRTFTVKTNYSASLADGKYGIIIAAGGTFNCQGADIWTNGLTDPDRTLLAADAAVNATSLTVADSTKWIDNDLIAIASTTVTAAQCELGAMAATTANTTLTVDGFGGAGGGIAYAHSGTSPTQAEIINLTRNVKITAYNSTYVGYVNLLTTSVSDIDWTEFSYLGANATNKRAIDIQTTSGSANINRCSFYNTKYGMVYFNGADLNNATLSNSVGYNINSLNNIISSVRIDSTTQTNWVINNNWIIVCGYNGFYIQDGGGTFTNNRAIGTVYESLRLTESNRLTGTFGNFLYHSCSGANGYALQITQVFDGIFSGITGWHNNAYGAAINNCPYITIDDLVLYGNTTINLNTGGSYLILNDPILNGTTTRSTTYGINIDGGAEIYIYSGDMSTSAGIKTAHTTDVYGGYAGGKTQIFCYTSNTKFGAATQVNMSRACKGSFVQNLDYGASAGIIKSYLVDKVGGGITYTIDKDTSYYHTDSPSLKITPASATYKQASNKMQIPVASGNNPTISVYFRKSAAYNGSQPRLVVKRHDSLGITADTVIATSTAAVDADVAPGTFTLLSGQPGAVSADGMLEVYVDCDGTTGYINICDWAVTGAETQADNLDAYYLWGLPFNGLLSTSAAAGGGGPIFKSGGIFN